VEVAHEPEVVAEKIVVSADGRQTNHETDSDDSRTRPPRGWRGRRSALRGSVHREV